jgi:predicted dehydrogenase
MPERRDFLKTSAASGLLLLKPDTVFGYQANSMVEIGVIGCGGRGNYIGNFFVEYTGSRVAAVADPFRDRMESMQAKFKVEPSRMHGGLDGYKALAASKLDAVVVESPVYFHPEHVAAGIEAGKHVFVAKPLAADVPGCLSIRRSGEKARAKNLNLLVDFQTRSQAVFQEAAQRVHRGDIGALVLGHVSYHAGRLQPKHTPGETGARFRLRNWVFDKALSGDIIVEQNIHVLDVANWYAQARPVQAFGTGGRKARVDVGDCWDHFLVTYWYPNDVKVDFSSAQFTKGYSDLCIRFYGARGTVDSHYNGLVRISGDNPWHGTDKDDTFRQGAVANVKNFVDAIKAGRVLNNVKDSVDSTLTAILGRMAAYEQNLITWEDMMKRNEKIDAKLHL